MVERVNNNISLQSYMEKNIWGPLGIKDIAFHLIPREDLQKRKADMSLRDPTGSGKAIFTTMNPMPDSAEDAFGGGGAFATAPEYLTILQSLLVDDGKLLKSKSIDLMFQPHLGDASREALMKLLEDPALNNSLGGLPLGTQTDWGLGGLLICSDLENSTRKGTMTWGGMPNLVWVSLLSEGILEEMLIWMRSGLTARLGFAGYTHRKSFPQETQSLWSSIMRFNEVYMKIIQLQRRVFRSISAWREPGLNSINNRVDSFVREPLGKSLDILIL